MARTDEKYGAIAEFLESRRAYVAFIGVCVLTGAVALVAGPTWMAYMAGIGVFVFAVDLISLTLWDRVEAYYERRETVDGGRSEPDRELTPHRISRNTKTVIVVGSILAGLYLLVGALAALLAG